MTAPSEHDEQVTVIAWASMQPYNGGKVIDWLWATPNGGRRDGREAFNLRAEGVKSGVPDLQLALPNDKYHGLFIEMKRSKRSLSKVSEMQKAMIERLNNAGYLALVCYGADEAIEAIKGYLSI